MNSTGPNNYSHLLNMDQQQIPVTHHGRDQVVPEVEDMVRMSHTTLVNNYSNPSTRYFNNNPHTLLMNQSGTFSQTNRTFDESLPLPTIPMPSKLCNSLAPQPVPRLLSSGEWRRQKKHKQHPNEQPYNNKENEMVILDENRTSTDCDDQIEE